MTPALRASTMAAALEAEVPPLQRPVQSDLRDEMLASLSDDPPETAAEIVKAAIGWTLAQFVAIEGLHTKAAAFNTRLRNAHDPAERDAAILDLAEQLGADAARLESDARALKVRFDADAVLERYRIRVGMRERAIAYGLDRCGELVARGLAEGLIDPRSGLIGEALANLLAEGRGWRGDRRIRVAAHRALRMIVERARGGLDGFWIDAAIIDTRRTALNADEDAWAQVDAMATLQALSPTSFEAVMQRRLLPSADQSGSLARDNRLFVRRQLAGLLADSSHIQPNHADWLQRLANDQDGAVRQALAFALPRMPETLARGLFAKLRVDRDPQVRAALVSVLPDVAALVGDEVCLALLERLLSRDQDEFVLRLGIAAGPELVGQLLKQDETGAIATATRLQEALTSLRKRSDNAKVRHWAGEGREALWLLADPAARAIAEVVGSSIAGQREGEARRIAALRGDQALVGRVLAVLAQNDFGYEFAPGRRPSLRRGDRFVRRWWRILYELKTSSTDKRQAWLHTIGRKFSGPIIAPAGHMAELAPTKVPGEPLHLGSEAGWRNFVPLLDHVLSAVDVGREFTIYTSEGVTLIVPPRGLFARIRCFLNLSRQFPVLAPLRNEPGHDYVVALRKAGVGIEFAPRLEPDEEPDPQITRLFSLGAALPAIQGIMHEAWAYFATVYDNTLLQLAVFIVLASTWFVGRHVWRGRLMRRRREGIALVLGGWGTRGKSGTERLKAALISGLGHPLVSKTTGCEAMFLLGRPFGDLQEMFLFRPYDKATIWEQFDLIETTCGLGARVFLWECMGLTPSYVRVLQKDWMRDDISTITNTYPDHEDVQGPAGRNIPEVMTQFIPDRGILLTTEEEMFPILREAAEEYGTRIRPVGWREAGLIHQSLLDRFPYAEHPFNIALVTAMADEMGLAADYAVKEMSDRVVADLGVLKIYPRATINDRTLEFVMGNSANERFGAMGNWTRMGFVDHDLAKDPEIFVSTVVNNRADRVPRSRVFARILVEDVAADQHVLIGSNIDGLVGFIEESWRDYAAKLTLYGDPDRSPGEVFAGLARHQRIPLDQDQLAGRLSAMLAAHSDKISMAEAMTAAKSDRLAAALEGAGVPNAAATAAYFSDQQILQREYAALVARLGSGGEQAALDAEVRALLRKCFMAKLIPVREYYTPGEDLIRLIAEKSPPGLINRIMGMQNIKGTGLDFVYRWQAWEACHRACQQALETDPAQIRRGLDLLGAFQEYGALSDGPVRETVAALKARGGTDEAALDAILTRLDAQMAALSKESAGENAGGGGGKLGQWIESFLDSTDAVRRRRAADKIYRELIAEQISSQRAAYELKKLTARQKGGWLGPSLMSLGESMRALLPWIARDSAKKLN
ncbi:MAG: hypothetical protein ABL912_01160 [Novosphingobium sp.]